MKQEKEPTTSAEGNNLDYLLYKVVYEEHEYLGNISMFLHIEYKIATINGSLQELTFRVLM